MFKYVRSVYHLVGIEHLPIKRNSSYKNNLNKKSQYAVRLTSYGSKFFDNFVTF